MSSKPSASTTTQTINEIAETLAEMRAAGYRTTSVPPATIAALESCGYTVDLATGAITAAERTAPTLESLRLRLAYIQAMGWTIQAAKIDGWIVYIATHPKSADEYHEDELETAVDQVILHHAGASDPWPEKTYNAWLPPLLFDLPADVQAATVTGWPMARKLLQIG